MNPSFFAKNKSALIAGAVIVVIIVVAVMALRPDPPVENQAAVPNTPTTTSTAQAQTAEPEATVTISAIPDTEVTIVSPLSPVSPVGKPAPLGDEAIDALIEEAIVLHRNGDLTAALELYDRIIAEYPDEGLAYNGRGSVYTDLAQYEAALADYTKAIEIVGLFPHALYNRGRVYGMLEQYDEALDDLQRAASLSYENFGYTAHGNIGLLYHKQGLYDEALQAFNRSIAANSEEKADIYFYRAETYTAMEDYQAAMDDYQAAIDRFADYGSAYEGLGYAHYKAGQLDQAKQALEQAIAIADRPVSHLYLMLLYLSDNNTDQAKAEATQAMALIEALPEDTRAVVLNRVTAEMDTLAQDNGAQADDIEEIITIITEK